MPRRTADRVRDTSTSTGTGAAVVSGTAPSGFRTFADIPGIAVGSLVDYWIQHRTANEWESGVATYSAANTLTRSAGGVLAGSAGAGALVNFTAGTKDVSQGPMADMVAFFAGYAAKPAIVKTITGATHTLTDDDNGRILYFTNAGGCTLTTAQLEAGFNCTLIQGAAGAVTVAQGASTTLSSHTGSLTTAGQNALATLVAPVANTFILGGALS